LAHLGRALPSLILFRFKAQPSALDMTRQIFLEAEQA
jgi:hypothetical protein